MISKIEKRSTRRLRDAVAVITAGTQDQQRFNYQLDNYITLLPVLLHMQTRRAVVAVVLFEFEAL